MLINMLVSDSKKRVKVMTWVGLVMFVGGAIALLLSFTDTLQGTFMGGFYGGLGAVMMVIGSTLIVVFRLVLKNPERRKKIEIKGKDERNHFIIQKAATITFFAMIFLLFTAMLIVGSTNSTIFTTLLIVFGTQGGIFFLLLVILRLFN